MNIEPAHLSLPDEEDFVEFFGTAASKSDHIEGYWLYELDISDGLILAFSFNIHERSIQTAIKYRDNPVDVVSHELATRIIIDRAHRELLVEFEGRNSRTELRISAERIPLCRWSTLSA